MNDISGSLVQNKNTAGSENNITDILKTSLPLLILGSRDKSMLEIIMFPIMSYLIIKSFDYIPIIYNKIYYLFRLDRILDRVNYLYNKYQLDIMKNNQLYSQINRYIVDHYSDNINRYKYTENKDNVIDRDIEFDSFNYCVEDVEILKTETNYIIYSHDKENINKFIDNVKRYNKKILDQITDNYISIYDWNYDKKCFEAKKVVFCNKNIENVFLSDENTKLIDYITQFKKNKNVYTRLGLPHKLGVLMYGQPGCGKSSTIYAIAEQYGKKIYKLSFKKIKSKSDFDALREKIPKKAVVVIEDADCVTCLKRRTMNPQNENFADNVISVHNIDTQRVYNNACDECRGSSPYISFSVDGGKTVSFGSRKEIFDVLNKEFLKIVDSYRQRAVDGFGQAILDKLKEEMTSRDGITLDDILEFLDGYHDLQDCIIIMTTNHKELMDDAVIRHGRMDLHVEFKLCNSHQFNNIFEYYTGKKIAELCANFKFPENTFSTAKIINEFVLPNIQQPELILTNINLGKK
ncbi:AAA family ATPase [Catovirus CTV1]|uniref:AAA family ATPase n=1 Tax=Catovirus CTV1 TaxID=1977631 RepID=A0A1V0SBK5_9VIRU|nr:AAA family ATPase [Catovirus CTV1]